MRRILIATLVGVLAFSAFVFAGPYFVVENVGLTLAPSLIAGWDFNVPFVDMSNMSIAGDFFIVNDNLAKYPTNWIGGYALDFSFVNAVGYEYIGLGFGMGMELKPSRTAVLESAMLKSWTTTLGIYGYPSDVVTIYGVVECVYDLDDYLWTFSPTIGLECRW